MVLEVCAWMTGRERETHTQSVDYIQCEKFQISDFQILL